MFALEKQKRRESAALHGAALSRHSLERGAFPPLLFFVFPKEYVSPFGVRRFPDVRCRKTKAAAKRRTPKRLRS